MKKDDRKTLIVILVVCAICGIVIFLASRKSNFDKLSFLEDYGTYFSVISEVNKYIEYVANNDNERVNYLFDNKYLEENSIIESKNYSAFSGLSTNGIEYVNIGKNFLYLVNGKIVDNGFDYIKVIDDNFSVIVLHDLSNNSYSIYPINGDNYRDVINGIRKIKIDNNNYNNIINTEEFDDVQICKIYFSDYYNKMFNATDGAYDLLSDNMKKKYPTYEDFKKYINDNVEKITPSSKLCKKDEYKGSRVYSVIDSNDNSYTFTEKGVMNYRVNFYFNNK